jgi:hypothetical protein
MALFFVEFAGNSLLEDYRNQDLAKVTKNEQTGRRSSILE